MLGRVEIVALNTGVVVKTMMLEVSKARLDVSQSHISNHEQKIQCASWL